MPRREPVQERHERRVLGVCCLEPLQDVRDRGAAGHDEVAVEELAKRKRDHGQRRRGDHAGGGLIEDALARAFEEVHEARVVVAECLACGTERILCLPLLALDLNVD